MAEVLFATALVLAHTFLGLRYEIYILAIVATASFRIRGGSWAAVGFVRPKSWRRTIIIAALGALALFVGTVYAVYPLGKWLGLDFSGNSAMGSDLDYIAQKFIRSWTVLAFVQQPIYFRYILERFADIFGNTQLAYWMSALYVAILFAMSHFHLGTIALIPYAGFVFAAVYLLSGRNTWAVVLARGIAETAGLTRLLFGLLLR